MKESVEDETGTHSKRTEESCGRFRADGGKGSDRPLWMHEKGLPAAYTAALRESAEKETGWCRFRDRIFLPLVIDGAIWMTGKMLERMTVPHSVK